MNKSKKLIIFIVYFVVIIYILSIFVDMSGGKLIFSFTFIFPIGLMIFIFIIFKTIFSSNNNIITNIPETKKRFASEIVISDTKCTVDGHTKSLYVRNNRVYNKVKAVISNSVSYPSTYTFINQPVLYIAEPIKEVEIDPIYLKDLDDILEEKIKSELPKNNANEKTIIPYLKRRKYAISILFAILNFICLSFIFFHLPLWTLLLEIVNIIIFIIFSRKIDLISYLKKQIKARPDEKMSDVISSLVAEQVPRSKLYLTKTIIIAASFILPIIIYFEPHIFYENYENGYGVRFYTIGLANYTKAEIPETHNGRKVLSIRGNVFANILTLKEVVLPDTIEEIRGNAFLNDRTLEKINLPKNLKYLGGSAFKNCSSLKKITIPLGVTEINGETFKNCSSLEEIILHDNITSIHGETFVNCTSLQKITLPSKITEINGNTFENCSSLKSIDIPEGVTRIGGHAFYGCSSLSSVTIPDSVNDIGSSAFRQCSSLYTIEIPANTSVNSRAFKESPTVITRRNGNQTYAEDIYE